MCGHRVRANYALLFVVLMFVSVCVSTHAFRTGTSEKAEKDSSDYQPAEHRGEVKEELSEEERLADYVCSEQDLPEEVLRDFDRCTKHIPAYRVSDCQVIKWLAFRYCLLQKLNLLERCRREVFGRDIDPNDQRKLLCGNETIEKKVCRSNIRFLLLSENWKQG